MAFTPATSIGSGGGGGGGVVQEGARDATAQAWLVDGSAVTQPVSGTVAVSNFPASQVVADSQTITDNAPFADGTSKVFMGGYVFDEVAGTALTENDAAAARIDSKRAAVHVIEDATVRGRRAAVSAGGSLSTTVAGTVTVSGSVAAAGDVASGVADSGNPVKIGGKGFAGTPTAVADAQRVDAWFDRNGALTVSPAGQVAGADGVSNGLIAYERMGNTNTGLAAEALHGFNGLTWDRLRSTVANGLAVDVTRIAGNVGVTQATSPWVTNDPGLPDALGQAAAAASTSVVIASDQPAVPVTVAGTVAVSAASLPLPAGAATEATLAQMRADLDAMRESLNEVALTAIVHREALEAA